MIAAMGYFDRRNANSARTATSQVAAVPTSPQTPQRLVSSSFSSPGAGYRAEEDYVVIEVGARHFSAGFVGDSRPRCSIGFGHEESARIGDYRKWLPGFTEAPQIDKKVSEWGTDHELWRMDTKHLDLGLVEDKLERAVREAYSRYLLLDPKSRKVLLAIPSMLPHPLLASTLSVLFSNFQIPSIMLLPSPHLTILGAGQRSGIVVDIGWHETIITAVYEFRQIRQSRTTRAMKMVVLEMGKLLSNSIRTKQVPQRLNEGETPCNEPKMGIEFDFTEEVTMRLAWCDPGRRTSSASLQATRSYDSMAGLSPEDHSGIDIDEETIDIKNENLVAVPTLPDQGVPVELPYSRLRYPVESVFFAVAQMPRLLDDEEQTIHHLLYDALIALPADARATCMANIIITGGGSNIPGVKPRILGEITSLVQSRGWDPVWGKAADNERKRQMENSQNRRPMISAPTSPAKATGISTTDASGETALSEAAFVLPEPDTIQERLGREGSKERPEQNAGMMRCLESLGAWAGGSLAPSAKIKAIVDVEKEQFLQYGLAGAKKESEVSTAKSRQSMGPGLSRTVGHDNAAWTLSAWA